MQKDYVWHYQTPGLYLNGYQFNELVVSGALKRLEAYLGHGFCFEAAAMIMFALRNDKSAKLIQGWATTNDDERNVHAWVELKRHGRIYVVSPTWHRDMAIPRAWFYDPETGIDPEPQWVCNYQRFWNQCISKELYRHCKNPDTSYVLPALRFYRPDDNRIAYPDREFGFILHEDPLTHSFYLAMSRGATNKYGGLYRRPLTIAIIEEIFNGATEPSLEHQAQAHALKRRMWHRLGRP